MTYSKKLIEVTLPLDVINQASYRENYIYKGNPSAIHKWWAQRPFAASRAIIFSSLIDDPSEYLEDEEKIIQERQRLFIFLEKLIQWENMNNPEVLAKARLEIARSIARKEGVDLPIGDNAIRDFVLEKSPPLFDPFAGGGTIPLEGLRLGLNSNSSDLNPIAVILNKSILEFCSKYANCQPIHPRVKEEGQSTYISQNYVGAMGVAEDIKYYGKWVVSKALEKLANYYPSIIKIGEKSGDVIAWLWARSIKCPNPNCGAEMPLMNSFSLSTRKDRKRWANPLINKKRDIPTIDFDIVDSKPSVSSPKVGRGAKFRCLACDQIAPEKYLRNEFIAKRVSNKLISIVAITKSGREYFPPIKEHQDIVDNLSLDWTPNFTMDEDCPDLVSGRGYGISHWDEIFTNRQLITLDTLFGLLEDVEIQICQDVEKSLSLNSCSEFDKHQYAAVIKTFLAFALDKYAMYGNSHVTWYTKEDRTKMLFARQAIPMVWDFVENYPFSGLGGSVQKSINLVAEAVEPLNLSIIGSASHQDATNANISPGALVCTDPPYYDNISYSVLSDFFYVWLRKALKSNFPDLFSTILVPKEREVVAASYRFEGNQNKAKDFFEEGLRKAFTNIRKSSSDEYPTTIFYAYRQEESDDSGGNISTGWETMLEALINSGFVIVGTWPLRTERSGRSISIATNSLETSVVLVCRHKHDNTGKISRKDFIGKLRKELPKFIFELKQGNIAPVDLAQAAIGPGIGIFSQFEAIIEADGTRMTVRTALSLINKVLDEYLAEQEGDYDSDTRWAVSWFEQFGLDEKDYGIAESLSKAKNTSIQGLADAGILESRTGKVRLLKREDLDENWTPENDKRLTAWESVQYLIRVLDQKGEHAAAELLARLGRKAEPARELAYRLYTICERKGWAQDALGYNMLVVAWPRLKELAGLIKSETQSSLL